jgi:hypothetical protein
MAENKMNFSGGAELLGERLLDAAVTEHGEETALFLAKMVAALADGTELDHYQATNEVRRLFGVA